MNNTPTKNMNNALKKFIIRNVRYFDGTDEFKTGDIYICDGYYCEPFDTDNCNRTNNINDAVREQSLITEIDGTGLTAIPGLIDLHTHGCAGYDACDANIDALIQMAHYQYTHGTAAFLPATMTLPLSQLQQILQVIQQYSSWQNSYQYTCQNTYHNNYEDIINSQPTAGILGVYMEGPFISATRCGAQDYTHILPPSIEVFHKLHEISGGLIRILTIAPETIGAGDFIKDLMKDFTRDFRKEFHNNIILSLAHTDADYDCAMKSFTMGASHVTHLYNAMPPLLHRAPGVIGAASDYGKCTVELICDGIHVHPSMIRSTFRMFSPENIIFVSDSMRATGLDNGTYTLGGQQVTVNGKTAVLTKDGTIAGSVSCLIDCLRYAIVNAGIKPETAIACATMNPARRLGISQQYGKISPGYIAHPVLLDNDWNIVSIPSTGGQSHLINTTSTHFQQNLPK